MGAAASTAQADAVAALVLLNRRARGARALEPAMGEALAGLGRATGWLATDSVDAAVDAIAALPPGARVVVVGGDGTLHQLLPALLTGGHELGVVPAGSGDDSARAFGLRALSWRDALRHALEGRARAVDLGELRTVHDVRPFVSSLCAGFDAAVSARALHLPHGLGGLPRYLLATLAEIAQLRRHRVRVHVDGVLAHDGEALFASVVNTPTYGGGMPIAPPATIDDGRLDLVVAGRFGRAGALAMLPRLLLGRHLGHAHVRHASFTTLRIQADAPLPLAADGEVLHGASTVDVAVAPAALRVVTAAPPPHGAA